MIKRIITIVIILIVLLLVGIYLYFENNTLEVSKYDINSSKISKEFNGYKIAQISDFHNTKSSKLKKSIIESLKEEKPNIIVITGDLIDSYRTNIDISINFIKEINEIAPIYYVTGNHESRIKDYKVLMEKLEENKVIILDDEVKEITVNDSIINLIGIKDPTLEHQSYLKEKEIVDGVLKKIDYNNNNFSILLSHRPELLDIYNKYNYDLVFSGHAHGGQIRLPYIGGLVAPNQWLFPKYDAGIYEIDNTKMIVSRGIGNSILPFRINNNPELIYVTLNHE